MSTGASASASAAPAAASASAFTCANLTEYLRTLSSEVLERLYHHPATCLAVFRELPQLAQQYAMRLLYVEQSVPQAVVQSWSKSARADEAKAAAKALSGLGVWVESSMPGGMPAWLLNKVFRRNLKVALVGGGIPWNISGELEPDPNKRDVAYLDQYAKERWDTVLHYMVGSSQQEGISADAVRILLHSALMRIDETDQTPVITRSGFQFLLMETAAQVWYFVLQYLDTIDARGLDLVECLNLLFQLSFSTLGQDYSTGGLSQGLLSFLQHLREFGLVYQRKRNSGRFYPTRLALNIASGETKGQLEQHREGFIVVETNYRLYAYTSSDLQVALVGLFAEPIYRFPNLTVAVITRDSVRQALRGGITSTQIIRFLRMHAHAQTLAPRSTSSMAHMGTMVTNKGPIPATVMDQIRLWEQERDRFTFTPGVLYNQFLSSDDFKTVRNFADSTGVSVWANERNRTIVVTKDGHDPVKKFWKKHSKGGS